MALPVEARKRMVFTFACRAALPAFPLLIDPTGAYVRPEGDLYLSGMAPPEDADPPATDFAVDHAFFEETLWPIIATRVPAFEAIKPGRAWAGHYDFNTFDQNALVGPLPGFANLHVATGFSGHGLQQAPAVGRGLAELIVHGRYQSLDLSPLGCRADRRGAAADRGERGVEAGPPFSRRSCDATTRYCSLFVLDDIGPSA